MSYKQQQAQTHTHKGVIAVNKGKFHSPLQFALFLCGKWDKERWIYSLRYWVIGTFLAASFVFLNPPRSSAPLFRFYLIARNHMRSYLLSHLLFWFYHKYNNNFQCPCLLYDIPLCLCLKIFLTVCSVHFFFIRLFSLSKDCTLIPQYLSKQNVKFWCWLHKRTNYVALSLYCLSRSNLGAE